MDKNTFNDGYARLNEVGKVIENLPTESVSQ